MTGSMASNYFRRFDMVQLQALGDTLRDTWRVPQCLVGALITTTTELGRPIRECPKTFVNQ